MKNLLPLTLTLCLILNFAQAQNIEDTEDFIIEQVQSIPPDGTVKNFIKFRSGIDKPSLFQLLDYEVSDDYYNNMCMYECSQYKDETKNVCLYGTIYVFDIRSVKKISITKFPDARVDASTLNLYLDDKYKATKIIETALSKEYRRKPIDVVNIYLANDKTIINKLKKAFLHLGILEGIEIKDGDLF